MGEMVSLPVWITTSFCAEMKMKISCVASIILLLAGTAIAQTPAISQFPIGLAYSSDAVNAGIGRMNALVAANGHQFATYYAADGSVVVAERATNDSKWDVSVEPFKGDVRDAHRYVAIGVSSDGLLHISYDHHSNPLHYRVSAKPYDIRSFGDEVPMTGKDEDHVTYPQFLSGGDGTLYFLYRDGASGNGSLCLNRYDVATKSWQVIAHPLIDGESKCNPYPWRTAIDASGGIHIAWCWRDTPNAETNHDLCYVRGIDGGRTWLRSDGKPQTLPITQENVEVIDPIPTGSNLINQCATATDAQGHPHLAQYFNDENGTPQYFDEWFDGSKWHKTQVSHRTEKFTIGGGGTLAIPISRPEIAIGKSGTVCFVTRDAEVGGGIRLYEAAAPYDNWQAIDLTHEDLGNWEPSYDLNRLRDDGVLSLFVLPVRQGNHERTTNFGPQEATVLEIPLP
jgi:BNR repeat-containing family member